MIDVMNIIPKLPTNSASMIIALPYHPLELAVESCWIWFKRFAALPQMGFFTLRILRITFVRTKGIVIAICPRKFLLILFPTCQASQYDSFHSGSIKTFLGTIFASCISRMYFKSFSTTRTIQSLIATLPPRSFITFEFIRGMTRLRAIKINVFQTSQNQIRFSTMGTNLFNLSAFPMCRFRTRLTFGSAITRAILSTMATVRMDFKYFMTMLTNNLYFIHGLIKGAPRQQSGYCLSNAG